MLHVVKRDGREVQFDSIKITNAIRGAADEIAFNLKESEIIELTQKVLEKIEDLEKEQLTVEEIQNIVEDKLLENGYKPIGVAFSNYRRERNKIREIKSDLMKRQSS